MTDNLMTLRYATSKDKDFYRLQSQVCGLLVEFAKKYDVHVHLIAHPRKSLSKTTDADDISGTSGIGNRADNIIAIERDEAVPGNEGDALTLSLTTLRVLKNRLWGITGNIKLDFETADKRFYSPAIGNNRKYGWEKLSADETANHPQSSTAEPPPPPPVPIIIHNPNITPDPAPQSQYTYEELGEIKLAEILTNDPHFFDLDSGWVDI
jgi:twinkle protein